MSDVNEQVVKAIIAGLRSEGYEIVPAAQQGGAAALPHKETIAREIRRAMLDNPTDASFNARAEKREKIADATADVILGLFRRVEQGVKP